MAPRSVLDRPILGSVDPNCVAFNEGDAVLLVDKTAPRGQWLIGRILQTFPGENGCVRSVSVRTKNGIVKRPIAKLCLLTAASDDDASDPSMQDGHASNLATGQ